MDDKYPSPLEALLSPRREPDKDLDNLAHAVIGAAIEVHRELVEALAPIHSAQAISYLKLTGNGLRY